MILDNVDASMNPLPFIRAIIGILIGPQVCRIMGFLAAFSGFNSLEFRESFSPEPYALFTIDFFGYALIKLRSLRRKRFLFVYLVLSKGLERKALPFTKNVKTDP